MKLTLHVGYKCAISRLFHKENFQNTHVNTWTTISQCDENVCGTEHFA